MAETILELKEVMSVIHHIQATVLLNPHSTALLKFISGRSPIS